MSSHGILHQSSCAYTQHNGVDERKNRHLVETARTLLLHHKVPQRFLGDAILAACYLSNRMSSSILHDQIPHSILFSKSTPLLPSPSCLWLCLFCSYFYSLTRQALSQNHKVCLSQLFLPSTRISLLLS